MLLKPLRDAPLVEQVTAGHLSGLLCQVLAAYRASGVLFASFYLFALFVSDLYLRQILY
jgi:hypothetical protein